MHDENIAKKEKEDDGKQEDQDKDDAETSKSPYPVVSSSRQRCGETKTMPMFSLDIPILAEFME